MMGHLTVERYLRNLSARYRQNTKKETGVMLDKYYSVNRLNQKPAIKAIYRI